MIFQIVLFASLGLFAAAYGAYVCAVCLNKDKVETILSMLLIPLMTLGIGSALLSRLPDSINVSICVFASLICLYISKLYSMFPCKKKFEIETGLMLLACVFFIKLLLPSYMLYSIPIFVIILCFLLYAATTAAVYIRFVAVKNLFNSFIFFVSFFIFYIMHFTSLITLIGSLRVFSVVLFIGISLFCICSAVFIIGFTEKKMIRTLYKIINPAAILIICTGFALMISLQR